MDIHIAVGEIVTYIIVKKCREMTVEELYNYIVETYKEKLTLKEIRDLILQ